MSTSTPREPPVKKIFTDYTLTRTTLSWESYEPLGNPYIYQAGVYHYLGQYPNDPTKQALVQIFQYADWPQGKPQELFSAPFDDQRDANRIMAMLKRAFGPMGFGDGVMPLSWDTLESFNGKLSYRVQIQSGVGQSTEQGGISNIEYKFVGEEQTP